ncbi:MAG: lysophospholipid acyltransferase family protein, partial [Casimicrobium sp.]
MPSLIASVALALANWLSRRSLASQASLGGALGRLMLLSGGMRNRLRENLAQAGYTAQVSLRQAATGIGRMAIETAGLWRTPDATVLERLKIVDGWDAVLAAKNQGRGIIFVTPHLGTFEMTSLFIGSQMPLTVMFRAPRVTWAEPMMRAGRDRMQIRSEPAEISGIRAMLKALRRGEAIGLLPDQVPDPGRGGEGAWAAFFGRPAYTITLVQKLAKTTKALVVMAACVRLPNAQGYRLTFTPLAPFSENSESAARELNAAVEAAIALAPDQYLWSYNRYKVPRGATPP